MAEGFQAPELPPGDVSRSPPIIFPFRPHDRRLPGRFRTRHVPLGCNGPDLPKRGEHYGGAHSGRTGVIECD
jgi:hypothetical protein